VSRTRRFGRRWHVRTVTLAAMIWGSASLGAADTNSLVDEIPPLRPPRQEVPATYWEQHRAPIIAGAVVGVMLMGGLVWVLTRPRADVIEPPEVTARNALSRLKDKTEDGVLISRVSQIVRHYVTARFGLPMVEYTTTDFCKELDSNEKTGPELAGKMADFLRSCDEHKFAPRAPVARGGWVTEALKLIEAAEARHLEVTRAAMPAEMRRDK
jgi:hypothetical protein